ncbi:MAG: Slp family lipoprotein [Escherichia coli]
MAVQKNVIKGILAGTFALMLSGCVTVPDAIKGSSPTPQQDLVRVMSAPQLYVGQEARFGGKVVAVQNQQGKTRLEIATVPLDSGARPTLGEPSRGRIYADVNGFLDPGGFPWATGDRRRADHRRRCTAKSAAAPYKFAAMQVNGLQTLASGPAGDHAASSRLTRGFMWRVRGLAAMAYAGLGLV